MRTVEMTAKCTDSHVTLKLIDAFELSDLLGYLFDWLRGASDTVVEDLIGFGSDPQAARVVMSRLSAFTQLLICGEADFEQDDNDLGNQDRQHLNSCQQQVTSW